MPGNAGGAKGPDFWHASEDGEVKVIGDMPTNTGGLVVKPIGKPSAGNRHARFDERGRL